MESELKEMKQLNTQIEIRDENGPWRKWFEAGLIVKDRDVYFVNVFLRMGIEIMWLRRLVSSIDEATVILKEYEGNENFLVGSVEKADGIQA